MTTTLALTGAALIDGTGADPVSGRVVVVAGGRIREIARTPPPGAEVVDLTGCTLVPGLIDAHAHLGLSSDLQALVTGQVSAAEIAAAIFGAAGRALREGFTTVRDCGGIDAGVVRAIASGAVPGPRVLTSGPILSQTGGGGHYAPPWEPSCRWETRDMPGLLGMSLLADGPDEMRRAAREAFRRGAGFLKLMVTGAVLANGDELDHTQLCVEEIAAAVREARARNTYVTAHAHNNAGIRNALEAGVTCVEHGSRLDERTAAEMKRHGASLVPTLSVARQLIDSTEAVGLPPEMAGRAELVMDGMRQAVLVAREAGVPVGSGSDLIGPDQSGRARELVLKAELLGPMGALVSATRTNAEILGLADEIGTVAPGRCADLVALDGSPLDDPTVFLDPERIRLVVHRGRVISAVRNG
ncbi:metal-dependent hydrolase family protein [Actinomadura chibensis]|uniref:Amidohydrolase family protein n=1 Tax=Actinomadura chibensis TaxID=392828 RepID=A0A5D0NDD0_9ACTN|nr:amidohydrolase family protein [Actinomadura chibensis]TYB42215.1 amidohydrolase family protein [Actinomadura chibensis]